MVRLNGWPLEDGDLALIAKVNGPTCTVLELARCVKLTDRGLSSLSVFRYERTESTRPRLLPIA